MVRFSKNTQISNVMEIHPVGADLFHVVGQMDRHDEVFFQFLQTCLKNGNCAADRKCDIGL